MSRIIPQDFVVFFSSPAIIKEICCNDAILGRKLKMLLNNIWNKHFGFQHVTPISFTEKLNVFFFFHQCGKNT
jgi:hypothetical protein